MSERPEQPTTKDRLKHLSMRLMRPGLDSVHQHLDAIADQITGVQRTIERTSADRLKYDSELDYWRYLVLKGGAQKDFGEPFDVVFGRWMRKRLLKLGVFLGLPGADEPGGIDDWCSSRSVVEIGAGPFPAVAAAARGWTRCVAVDPIARGYVENGLVPESCRHVVYIEAPGELIPLASGSADLVICENCLDHVTDPSAVIREIERLLAPGGHLWIFVDLSEHQDHMHPHPMSDQKMRALLARFEPVRVEVSSHKAHPEAYGGFRALYRKPAPTRLRTTSTCEARPGAPLDVDKSLATDANGAAVAPTSEDSPRVYVNGSFAEGSGSKVG